MVRQPHPLGGVLLLFSDITDELKLRSRFNAQLQVQTATLDKLNDAVAVFGSDGRLRLHNEAFETFWSLSAERIAKMKPGARLINCARGGLVDEAALATAIAEGRVAGAGIDVFASEPCTDSPLFELPQVVVTPHLGASTSEAQDRAGTDVAKSVRLALAGHFVPDAVNITGGAVDEEVAPWLEMARKLGVLVGAISSELPSSIVVDVRGDVVVINAGLKSEGIVPIEQFRNDAGEIDVGIGDTVKVALDSLENGFGETVLSREKAKRAM